MDFDEIEIVLETPMEDVSKGGENPKENHEPEGGHDREALFQKVSYRDSLTGYNGHGNKESTLKENEWWSDDDEKEDDEEKDCPVTRLTKEEKKHLREPWLKTLIIKVWGRSVGYNYLLRRLKTLWKPTWSFDLVSLDHEYFLAKFSDEQDYMFAKYEGPWMVLDHYLVVKKWRPNFQPTSDKTEKLLVRVRFPCLPIEYFNGFILQKIGEKIGRPIQIDQTTGMASKGRFARMCIEVDITKPLLAKYKLRKRT